MIYALHGFLGKPDDWQKSLPQAVHLDLFKPPIKGFEEWADEFNASAAPGSIVVGYSLGGRLALHALCQNPSLWKGAVIISANPGLKEEKATRLQQDRKWAKRFLNDPWDKLMTAWNSQPVFSGFALERKECDFDRALLCMALEKWSLGVQDDLLPSIKRLPLPILWITGEKERKEPLSFAHPQSRHWVAPGAGHRVPWETKTLFQQQLDQFIGEIS